MSYYIIADTHVYHRRGRAILACRRSARCRDSCRRMHRSHRTDRGACEQWKHRMTCLPLHNRQPHSAALRRPQRAGHTADTITNNRRQHLIAISNHYMSISSLFY